MGLIKRKDICKMSIRNATETEKWAWRIMGNIIPSFNRRWKAYNINFDYTSEDNISVEEVASQMSDLGI